MKYYSYLIIRVYCSMRMFLLPFLFATICVTAYGQSKLSVKFNVANSRHVDDHATFSISFDNEHEFRKKYNTKLDILYQHYNNVQAVATYSLVLNEMLNDANVLFIDLPGKPNTEAGIDFVNPAFNRITKVHTRYSSLTGASEKISIKEKRFDPENIDLINRSFTTPLTPSEITQHATTMATLIAGAGNSSIQSLGVVPAAQITSSDFDNLLPDPDQIFITNEIYLQNHSYGVLIENYYGNEAAAYDAQVDNNPTLMHVFSAGNLGHSKPTDGQYKDLPYANLSGNFKQAKNVILTTAVDTSLLVNSLNSRGPAYDGRLKPELAAYGQGGTSDAAALVTGVSALVQEKYKSIHGELPLASTIKAIFIATADDIGQPGVDYTYGYGSLNAYKAVKAVEELKTFEESIGSNDFITVPIVVDPNIAILKIAVAWNDPAAPQNSSKALIHDLDCTLNDGTSDYLPWVLSNYPTSDSLSSPAKRKRDQLNNVEYITIDNPTSGSYNLNITSPALTTSNQKVSIVYWTDKKIFEWDYPISANILQAKTKQTLLWNYPYNESADLFYQLNSGDWQILKENLNLSSYFHWTLPDTLATAKLKMVINGDEFLSDEFIVSPLPKLNVAFNCENDLSLSWKELKNAEGYKLYTLGEKYLEEKITTADTSVILAKKNNQIYFAVAPTLNGLTGLRSQTINYNEQGAYCYINFFSAERFESNIITLQLKLSTYANIDLIKIYKTTQGITTTIVKTAPNNNTVLEFLDQDLMPGSIQYQAEVILKNGISIKSSISEIFIETKNKAIIFPNPITNDETLNVLTEGQGLKLSIINTMGQLVDSIDLELTLDTVDLSELPNGIYLYQLTRDGKVLDRGKIVKK
jgi:hypothetical protein